MAAASRTRGWSTLEDTAVVCAILDTLPDPTLIVGADADTMANGHAAALLGLHPEHISRDTVVGALTVWRADDSGQNLAEIVAYGLAWTGLAAEVNPAGWRRQRHVSVAPVDVDGHHLLVVGFRDPDPQMAATQDRAAHDADRAIVLAVMHDVRPEPTVEETSLALCTAVARVEGIDGAMLMVLPPKGDLVHVTNYGPPLPGFEFGSRVPIENLEALMQMTAAGPWYLDFADAVTGELLGQGLANDIRGAGITATAYAPILQGDTLVGVLCVASEAVDGVSLLRRKLDALEQIGAFAGMVLANQAILFGKRATVRQEVASLIDEGAFVPFVQPIVSLSTGAIVGFEALTRFDDGRSPDRWFSDAHSVGLGIELEEACARRVLASVGEMWSDEWLSINFSPEALIGGVLGRLPDAGGRRLVVEITEHSAIEEYAEIRSTMAAFPAVDISIDDAGAGFASLRHILELAPEFVKLDIGMVRDVDTDPTRAAMVAGMVNFALATGTALVAEGVETAAEAETLTELGVQLAQGYYFHRPAPIADFGH